MRALVIYLIGSILLLSFSSCSCQNKTDSNYKDFPIPVTDIYKRAWSQEFTNNMGMRYFYKLKEPTYFRNIPIEGVFMLKSNGELVGFTLSKTFNYKGTILPKGSTFEKVNDNDYFFSLPKDTVLHGFPIYHREDGFIYWTHNNVEFYSNGKIKSFGLAKNMEIEGIRCNARKNNRRVILFKNGKLRHAHLSANKEIQGYQCHGGEVNNDIWFKINGQLLSFILASNNTIDGKLYNQGTQIIFDNNNKVHPLSGRLAFLSFYDNDELHNVVLEEGSLVQGYNFSKNSRIIFSKTGKIETVRTTKHITIDGIPCKKKEWLGFHPNGQLSWCKLADDIKLNGKRYKKGIWLNFHKNGDPFIKK